MRSAVRILVANRPKLMRELILATLSDEPGIEIVGEVSDEADIRQQVRLTTPDLLATGIGRTGQATSGDLRHACYETSPAFASSQSRRKRIAASSIGRRSIFTPAKLNRPNREF